MINSEVTSVSAPTKKEITRLLELQFGTFVSAALHPFKNAAMWVLNTPDVSAKAMEQIVANRNAIQDALIDPSKPTELTKPWEPVNWEIQQALPVMKKAA